MDLPPALIQCRAPVVENVQVARDTYRVRLAVPEIAARIVPGQFIMLRVPDRTDPLLGRAMALYDTYLDRSGQPAGIDVVYMIVGKATGLLSERKPGDELDVWGPLGNGFRLPMVRHLMLVAGGIGQTPLLALAREYLGLRKYGQPPRQVSSEGQGRRPQATLCYGVRTAELLAGVADFEAIGVEVKVATDDGTAGHHGFVTDLVEMALQGATGSERSPHPNPPPKAGEGRVGTVTQPRSPTPDPRPPDLLVGCGPMPMMAALARVAARYQVPCLVSLESPMACGFGVCFSCVARIRQPDGSWDYRRVCIDGPVFDAALVGF